MIEQLLQIDEKLFFAINTGWGSPLSDGVMTLASEAGSAGVLFIFGIFYILLWEKEKRRARLITFILTMGVAGALLLIAKDYFNRDRPLKHFETEIAKSEVFIRAPHHQLHKRSFPSGHSQAAFSAATFFALYYRRYRLLLFSAASMVAISRIFLGVHYPVDIVVGSLAGAFIAWLFWRLDPTVVRSGKKLDTKQGSV